MELRARLDRVKEELARAALACGRDPSEITLVAATKTQSGDTIRRAIAAGVTVCGENRVQELTAHLEEHAYDGAEVHFIGHLQTNKVKYVVGKVALIHSVSSEKLLLAIEKQAKFAGVFGEKLRSHLETSAQETQSSSCVMFFSRWNFCMFSPIVSFKIVASIKN